MISTLLIDCIRRLVTRRDGLVGVWVRKHIITYFLSSTLVVFAGDILLDDAAVFCWQQGSQTAWVLT